MDMCYICDENPPVEGDILCQNCIDIEKAYREGKNAKCKFCGEKATEIYLNCTECENIINVCDNDDCMNKAYYDTCACKNLIKSSSFIFESK